MYMYIYPNTVYMYMYVYKPTCTHKDTHTSLERYMYLLSYTCLCLLSLLPPSLISYSHLLPSSVDHYFPHSNSSPHSLISPSSPSLSPSLTSPPLPPPPPHLSLPPSPLHLSLPHLPTSPSLPHLPASPSTSPPLPLPCFSFSASTSSVSSLYSFQRLATLVGAGPCVSGGEGQREARMGMVLPLIGTSVHVQSHYIAHYKEEQRKKC